jgi:hypothetical protein
MHEIDWAHWKIMKSLPWPWNGLKPLKSQKYGFWTYSGSRKWFHDFSMLLIDFSHKKIPYRVVLKYKKLFRRKFARKIWFFAHKIWSQHFFMPKTPKNRVPRLDKPIWGQKAVFQLMSKSRLFSDQKQWVL